MIATGKNGYEREQLVENLAGPARESCKILASNATTQATGTLATTIWDSCTIHALTLFDFHLTLDSTP